MMGIRYIGWSILLLLAPRLNGQGYYYYNENYYEPAVVWEVNAGLGGMNSITDIYNAAHYRKGLMEGVTFRRMKLATSLSSSATLKDWVALRLDLTLGRTEAYDSDLLLSGKTAREQQNAARNLNFHSSIFEVSGMAELHPLPLFSSGLNPPPPWSPYIVGGLGFFSFDPMTELDGQLIRLAPLRLEGQGFAEYPDRKPYHTHAFSFPMGVGLRYELGPMVNLRLEVIRRSTTTDFIDDVGYSHWASYNLYDRYLSPYQAALARRLHDRSFPERPPGSRKVRSLSDSNDVFWTVMFRMGIILNRQRR